MTRSDVASEWWSDPGRRRSRSWHPSAASGQARRVVLVGVKAVDRAAVGAAEYAERIPAVTHRGLHAAAGLADDVLAAWHDTMPEMPLEVVAGDDVVSALANAVRREIAAPAVGQVVVVLARRRCSYSTGTTLRGLVTALRQIDGVTPVVLPLYAA